MSGNLMPYLFGDFFVPTQLEKLQIWYDASVANNTNFGPPVPLNNQNINQWKDKSGTAHNANRSAIRNAPSWRALQLNNLGAGYWVNQSILVSTPINWSQSVPGSTIYIVARADDLRGMDFLCTDTGEFRIFCSDNSKFSVAQAGGVGVSNVAVSKSQFRMLGSIFDGTKVGNAERLKLRCDKVERPLTFTGNVGSVTSSIGKDLYLGYGRYGLDEHVTSEALEMELHGYMCEVLIWNRTLSPYEINLVEKYLSTKWGL